MKRLPIPEDRLDVVVAGKHPKAKLGRIKYRRFMARPTIKRERIGQIERIEQFADQFRRICLLRSECLRGRDFQGALPFMFLQRCDVQRMLVFLKTHPPAGHTQASKYGSPLIKAAGKVSPGEIRL